MQPETWEDDFLTIFFFHENFLWSLIYIVWLSRVFRKCLTSFKWCILSRVLISRLKLRFRMDGHEIIIGNTEVSWHCPETVFSKSIYPIAFFPTWHSPEYPIFLIDIYPNAIMVPEWTFTRKDKPPNDQLPEEHISPENKSTNNCWNLFFRYIDIIRHSSKVSICICRPCNLSNSRQLTECASAWSPISASALLWLSFRCWALPPCSLCLPALSGTLARQCRNPDGVCRPLQRSDYATFHSHYFVCLFCTADSYWFQSMGRYLGSTAGRRPRPGVPLTHVRPLEVLQHRFEVVL